MEGHRKPRRRPQDPRKSPMNVVAVAAQRTMLELQIDGVKLPDLATDIENVPVTEFSDAAMRAAQQVLIEVEHRDFENIIKLFLQTAGVRRNPTQIAVASNQREPLASAPGMTKGRGRDRRCRRQPRLGVDFERRHYLSLSTAFLSDANRLQYNLQVLSHGLDSEGADQPDGATQK